MRYIITPLVASLIATHASAEVPRVVTDFVATDALVATVMGDLGRPQALLLKGADPHDFQLRPSQALVLNDAQLVIFIGPEFTPWIAKALESLGENSVRLELLDLPETKRLAYGDDNHDQHEEEASHDHAKEAGHDHAAEEPGHDEHHHEGTDPHAWLDPDNAIAWLGVIADQLGTLDPENSATYSANAAAGATRIAALDAELKAQLAPLSARAFVVYHDAYRYFSAHYGLTVAGAISAGDAASPGAARLRALQTELSASGSLCLFPEVNHDAGLAHQMIDGTEIRLGAPLDPEGTSIEPGPQAYDALMRALAQTLTDCLAD